MSFKPTEAEDREIADYMEARHLKSRPELLRLALFAYMRQSKPGGHRAQRDTAKGHGTRPDAGGGYPPRHIKDSLTPSSNPEEAQKEKELYHRLEAVFLDKNGGRFDDYGKEGKALHGLISKARAREPQNAEGLLVSMAAALWTLKQGREQFWRGQPFLPSALNASGIWSRVLESMRVPEGQEAALRVVAEGIA